MRIVFVSYEYPPDTGFGGIGTYVYQVTHLLSERGIDVEVICGTDQHDRVNAVNDHLILHRLQTNSREEFRKLVPAAIKQIIQHKNIDIIEAPEYGAESLYIKPAFPDIPLIVKLHTPAYLIKKLNDHYFDKQWHRKIKYAFAKYRSDNDVEYKATRLADYVTSPSVSLGDIISRDWNMKREEIILSPYPYKPNTSLLNIPADDRRKTVLYMGRLETRKGVYNLAKAIPFVLKQVPDANFVFLGKDDRGPWRKATMKDVLLKELGRYAGSVRFIDHVPLSQIPDFLSTASVCVFPSLWENFPNVCLEAMSAARGGGGGGGGGGAQMLQPCEGGLLVDPHDVQAIADSISNLLQHPVERIAYGKRCRQRIMDYHANTVPNKIVEQYK
ncbi:MAG: glycosyltransferase family 4 protein, partial [Flavisolibacter sp.]